MITIKNVHKRYGTNQIFKDFDLTINEGEFVGILGHSGNGKTTLLNMIGSLEKPDKGEIEINGTRLHKNAKVNRSILKENLGFLFQNYTLMDNYNVRENLEIAFYGKKITNKMKSEEIDRVLGLVNLSNRHQEKIYTLSGGEQQRIAFARLLLKDPPIILADEPTGSLDENNRDKLMELLKSLHSDGKTIVMVTHDTSLIKYFSRTITL